MKKDKISARPVLPLEERRAIQAVEGEKAMAEYLDTQEKTRAKTERLRQLRINKNPTSQGGRASSVIPNRTELPQ